MTRQYTPPIHVLLATTTALCLLHCGPAPSPTPEPRGRPPERRVERRPTLKLRVGHFGRHSYSVEDLLFSRDLKHAVTLGGGTQNQLASWELQQPRPRSWLHVSGNRYFAGLALHPQGRELVMVVGNQLGRWSMKKGEPVKHVLQLKFASTDLDTIDQLVVRYLKKGDRVIVQDEMDMCAVVNLRNSRRILRMPCCAFPKSESAALSNCQLVVGPLGEQCVHGIAGTAVLSSLKTGKPIQRLKLQSAEVFLAATFNAKRSRLATWSGEVKGEQLQRVVLRLWSLPDGRLLKKHLAPQGVRPGALAFDQAGRLLASYEVRRTGDVSVWDALAGRVLHTWRWHALSGRGVSAKYTELAPHRFGPKGRLLGVGAVVPLHLVFDVKTGRLAKQLGGVGESPTDADLDRGGRTLAVGTDGGRIYLWDLAAGKVKRLLNLAGGSVEKLAFIRGPSPSGTTRSSLLVLQGNGRLQRLDPPLFKTRWTISLARKGTGKQRRYAACKSRTFALDAAGRTLITFGAQGLVRRDPTTGKPQQHLTTHRACIDGLDLSASGHLLAGQWEHYYGQPLWALPSGQQHKPLLDRKASYGSPQLTADARWLATNIASHFYLWNLKSRRFVIGSLEDQDLGDNPRMVVHSQGKPKPRVEITILGKSWLARYRVVAPQLGLAGSTKGPLQLIRRVRIAGGNKLRVVRSGSRRLLLVLGRRALHLHEPQSLRRIASLFTEPVLADDWRHWAGPAPAKPARITPRKSLRAAWLAYTPAGRVDGNREGQKWMQWLHRDGGKRRAYPARHGWKQRHVPGLLMKVLRQR